jgi:D-alanyl-D-alanine carboxypeptidase
VVGSSWHAGCPVGLDELRHVRLSYWNFKGEQHVGELIVHRSVVEDIRTVFSSLFLKRFPIRQMRLVDDYGADDFVSIEADNTSAFNCRTATGSSRWSEHAYGRALDVNPIENPYVNRSGMTSHTASIPYLDRSRPRPGMAVSGGALVAAFESVGWGWGGRWDSPKDYQHFSANGQ